jgi:hypothetical protein
MEKSESIKNLAVALMKAQEELKEVARDTKAYNYNYATLPKVIEEYKRAFLKNGLVVTQLIEGLSLVTILAHESGEYIMSAATLNPVKNDPQGMGSAITYFRRYALSAICGIVSEDDDDGKDSSAPKAEAKHEAPRQAPAPAPRHDNEPRTLIEKLSEVRPTKSDKFFTLIFANGLKLGCGMHTATEATKALEADHKVSVEYGPNDKGYMTCLSLVEVIPEAEAEVPF